METQRQWPGDAADVALCQPVSIRIGGERLDKTIGCRVRGVTRAAFVQATNQVQIDLDRGVVVLAVFAGVH